MFAGPEVELPTRSTRNLHRPSKQAIQQPPRNPLLAGCSSAGLRVFCNEHENNLQASQAAQELIRRSTPETTIQPSDSAPSSSKPPVGTSIHQVSPGTEENEPIKKMSRCQRWLEKDPNCHQVTEEKDHPPTGPARNGQPFPAAPSSGCTNEHTENIIWLDTAQSCPGRKRQESIPTPLASCVPPKAVSALTNPAVSEVPQLQAGIKANTTPNKKPPVHDNSTSLYVILGVKPHATPANITTAYRRLAREWHPDRRLGKDDGVFKAITEAHTILSDEKRKGFYDRTGFKCEEDLMANRGAVPGVHPSCVRPTLPSAVTSLICVPYGLSVCVPGLLAFAVHSEFPLVLWDFTVCIGRILSSAYAIRCFHAPIRTKLCESFQRSASFSIRLDGLCALIRARYRCSTDELCIYIFLA